MTAPIEIAEAGPDDAGLVAELVHALICELTPGRADAELLAGYRKTAAAYIGKNEGYWAFLADAGDDGAVGVITLNECTAIYAGGHFGKIAELYIAPAYRSQGVGALLLDRAIAFAKARGWPRLEVGAPDQPRWSRTVDFYRRNGFVEVGPRLKRPVEG